MRLRWQQEGKRHGQVLLATQSVTLMNQFEMDDLIVVERQDGASVFDRHRGKGCGHSLTEIISNPGLAETAETSVFW